LLAVAIYLSNSRRYLWLFNPLIQSKLIIYLKAFTDGCKNILFHRYLISNPFFVHFRQFFYPYLSLIDILNINNYKDYFV